MRQQDDGKIRPGRLLRKQFRQRVKIGVLSSFDCNDGQTSAGDNQLGQPRKIASRFRTKSRLTQDLRGNLGITTSRGEDDCALREIASTGHGAFPSIKVP